jgi:uncharacterized membrane protein (Fun14 family)
VDLLDVVVRVAADVALIYEQGLNELLVEGVLNDLCEWDILSLLLRHALSFQRILSHEVQVLLSLSNAQIDSLVLGFADALVDEDSADIE